MGRASRTGTGKRGDLFKDGQQISTWRDYLGGHQYNSAFSHFLSEWVDTGANAWIWNNPNHVNILETLADGLGEAQTRRLIISRAVS